MIRHEWHEQELRCDKASLRRLGLDCTRFTRANDSSLEYLVKDHAVLLGAVDPAHLQQDVTWLHSIHEAVSLACCALLKVDLRILGRIHKLFITRSSTYSFARGPHGHHMRDQGRWRSSPGDVMFHGRWCKIFWWLGCKSNHSWRNERLGECISIDVCSISSLSWNDGMME